MQGLGLNAGPHSGAAVTYPWNHILSPSQVPFKCRFLESQPDTMIRSEAGQWQRGGAYDKVYLQVTVT